MCLSDGQRVPARCLVWVMKSSSGKWGFSVMKRESWQGKGWWVKVLGHGCGSLDTNPLAWVAQVLHCDRHGLEL